MSIPVGKFLDGDAERPAKTKYELIASPMRRSKELKKIVPIRVDDQHLEIVDELRRIEKDIPTRSEMIRRLIERAEPKTKR